jgi:hypothetical protein
MEQSSPKHPLKQTTLWKKHGQRKNSTFEKIIYRGRHRLDVISQMLFSNIVELDGLSLETNSQRLARQLPLKVVYFQRQFS